MDVGFPFVRPPSVKIDVNATAAMKKRHIAFSVGQLPQAPASLEPIPACNHSGRSTLQLRTGFGNPNPPRKNGALNSIADAVSIGDLLRSSVKRKAERAFLTPFKPGVPSINASMLRTVVS